MTEHQIIQAISINLLRMAEWYYKDPQNNVAVCQRYLEQSQKLSTQVIGQKAEPYLRQVRQLRLENPGESSARTAERFLTLGVLLQHPEKWMQV